MQPVRECMRATHFKKVQHNNQTKFLPCSPNDFGAIKMDMFSLKPEELLLPEITKSHWMTAVERNKPSVNLKELLLQEEFTKQFGISGRKPMLDHQPTEKNISHLHNGTIQVIKSSDESTPASPNVLPPNFRLPEVYDDQDHDSLMQLTSKTTEKMQQFSHVDNNNRNHAPQLA